MLRADFNNDPVKIYGIWPMTPFPVEVSIYGVCSNSCFYCFSNLNRAAADRKPEDHRKNPIEKVINGCEKVAKLSGIIHDKDFSTKQTEITMHNTFTTQQPVQRIQEQLNQVNVP